MRQIGESPSNFDGQNNNKTGAFQQEETSQVRTKTSEPRRFDQCQSAFGSLN
jgi:hypothetical protein